MNAANTLAADSIVYAGECSIFSCLMAQKET